jgi:hypothetical protein
MNPVRLLGVSSLALFALPLGLRAQSYGPPGPLVYVIATSASTQREAGRLMRLCRWNDTTALKDADMVLVVVRSSGSAPLHSFYDSAKWLLDDASSQLNNSGSLFHTYLYSIRKNLSLDETNHRTYEAESGISEQDLRGPRYRFGFGCDAY